MRSPLSKFELRLIAAFILPAVAPIVASLLFIPQLIQARFAELSHADVKAELDRHAEFYGDFFIAKKHEYSATARTLALDPLLVSFASEDDGPTTLMRLQQILDDHEEIGEARVRRRDGTTLAAASRDDVLVDYRPKTLSSPLGLGDAPTLELTFVLSKRYFRNQEQAVEIATLYDASLQTFGQRFAEKRRTYYAILGGVALLALLLGVWISRGVTRRIANLAAGTERVAKGDLDFEIRASGGDEIEELIRRFNRMLRALNDAQRRIIDLEKISGWQDFARRLAHEIKNPLTPIRLAVQELKRRAPEDQPKLKKLLIDVSEVVEDETSRLTRLVNEFSQFARLPDVSAHREDMGGFLEDFMRAYNGFEGRVGLELPSSRLYAEIDVDQMRQVLHNLVMNGMQANPDPTGRVDIALISGPEKNQVTIQVRDSGPGVPKEDEPKIFEPYFTTKMNGTGLGLAIVKKIVLQHHGTIVLTRPKAGGAQFDIRLPRIT